MSKPAPHCQPVSPELQAEAEKAEARKEASLKRLTKLLVDNVDNIVGQEPDAFERAMNTLIDADRAALKARGK